jgi:hypothetical protein
MPRPLEELESPVFRSMRIFARAVLLVLLALAWEEELVSLSSTGDSSLGGVGGGAGVDCTTSVFLPPLHIYGIYGDRMFSFVSSNFDQRTSIRRLSPAFIQISLSVSAGFGQRCGYITSSASRSSSVTKWPTLEAVSMIGSKRGYAIGGF